MTNENIEGKLAKLREEYKNKLPDKIHEIYSIWDKLQSHPNQDVFTLFHFTIHKLHGSSAMHGYAELGKIAGRIEVLANDLKENPNKLSEYSVQIKTLLTDLKETASHETNISITETNPIPVVQKGPMTIYLLQDDRNYEYNLSDQLTKFGYKINRFNDTNQLAENLPKSGEGIIIIDLNLMNEKLENKLIDQNKAEPKIPIIFISDHGEFSVRLKAVRMGGEVFFVKPFQIENLISQIEKLLTPESEVYRILIVDDELEVARYNATILEQANMETAIITKSQDIDRIIHEFNPDLILIDINMPDCNGLELAAIIRQQNVFESTPIIYLSAEDDANKKLNAMKLGADDFITKSTSSAVLVTTVKNRIERYKKLRALLVKDNLTGLYNHAFIRKQLEIELKESMLLHNPLSIALINLDKFKNINNTYGHQVGDHVLKSLAIMLQKRLHSNDIVGRYAVTKFLVILPNTNLETAKSIIDELRKHFLTLNYSLYQQIFNASFSAGIASFPDFKTVDELIEAADESISESKRAGINRVEVAVPNL